MPLVASAPASIIAKARHSEAVDVQGTTAVTICTVTFSAPGGDYWVKGTLEAKNDVATDTNVTIQLTDGSDVVLRSATFNLDAVATERGGRTCELLVEGVPAGTSKTYKLRVATNQAGGNIEIDQLGDDSLESLLTVSRG